MPRVVRARLLVRALPRWEGATRCIHFDVGMSSAHDTWAQAGAIVARIPQAQAAQELAAAFASPSLTVDPLSQDARADVVRGLQRTLRRWSRFVATGALPPASEFAPLREWTRARAAEGFRLEDLLRAFGVAHQLGWQLLRRYAREDETEVLLELAAPLARYVDLVSTVVTETYMAERELLVSEEERLTRTLLERLCVAAPLDGADSELAERLGVPVEGSYRPFAVVIPGRPPRAYAALAARMRRAGWRLAVTQSDSVVGLAWRALGLHDLGEGPSVMLAIGEPTPRAELAGAREEVALLVEHARRVGLLGRLSTEDHLLEILLERSPRLIARLSERVLAPLAHDDHGELAHTLRALVACRLDRTATSAALHVHRNTLAYRIRRIEEIAGLDLGSPRDLACAYVALAHELSPVQDAAMPARGAAAE